MTVAELLNALNEYEDDVEVFVGYLNGSTIMGTEFTLLESVDQDTKQPMLLFMTEEYKHIFN
jgi:hypothetical protein